jgi:L-fucose isomerase-like protein
VLGRAGHATPFASALSGARVSVQSKPLRMQPVLLHEQYQRREATSWRPWCGLVTEEHAEEERNRIRGEIEAMRAGADFPLEMLPLVSVRNEEEARKAAAGDHDGVVIYGASGGTGLLMALTDPQKWNLMFVRHRTGPAYLWYEIMHPRFLRRETDAFQGTGGMDIRDVVVDDHGELLWRMRALHGLKNIRNKRIIAIGGALGWDRGGHSDAPGNARERWGMDIVEVQYDELKERILAARADAALVGRCRDESRAYIAQPGVTLLPLQEELTTAELVAGKGSPRTLGQMEQFMDNAFLLTEVFRGLMAEHETDALTVGHCMGTIIPMSETTACMCLTLLNDAGCLAFCESDFVVIPSGILLHYISGKPVFFCNPTFPHKNTVTIAHCTAPRKMDGEHFEEVAIRTHFESDYGAAPKVAMRPGQEMTLLVPAFSGERWVGFTGNVADNPALDICTTQVDIAMNADSERLLEEMRGFHWMTCYGNYLRETGYALKRAGIEWLDLSATA